MKPGKNALPVESRYPLRGLNSSVPATQIPSSYSPSLENMQIRDGVVFKRSGYNELINQDLVGNVLALVDFELLDETRFLVALTSRRQYKLNDGTDVWDDITPLYTKTFNLVSSFSATVFKVGTTDLTTVFATGRTFTIEGTPANDGTYTVVSSSFDATNTLVTVAAIPATAGAVGTITINEINIVSSDATSDWFKIATDMTAVFVAGVKFLVKGTAASNGEYVVVSSSYSAPNTQINVAAVPGTAGAVGTLGVLNELTTVDGDTIDYVVGTDNSTHRLYMTNGRDRPRFWDGVTATFLEWFPDFTDFVTCKTIEVFFDHLVLGGIEVSDTEPKTVAWSDTVEFDDFETGTSGVSLIPGLSGGIKALEVLGDRLIIYSNDSIASMAFIGLPFVFATEVVVPNGVRLVSPRAIVSISSAHLFASQEDIYFFDGSRSLRPVGDAIRKLYKQDISYEFGSRLFCFNDVAKRTIYIVVPTGETSSVAYLLDYNIYDLNDFAWTRVEYADVPLCMSFFFRRDGVTWDSPPSVTWDDDYGIWDDEGEQVNFPVRIMGAGLEVMLMDETVGTDDGVAVTGFYETIDFVVPTDDLSVFGRWLEIEADLMGSEVDVMYSIDQGQNWTTVTTQVLESQFTHYYFPIDTTSRTLRIKLESTSFFALRWLRAWVVSGAGR